MDKKTFTELIDKITLAEENADKLYKFGIDVVESDLYNGFSTSINILLKELFGQDSADDIREYCDECVYNKSFNTRDEFIDLCERVNIK